MKKLAIFIVLLVITGAGCAKTSTNTPNITKDVAEVSTTANLIKDNLDMTTKPTSTTTTPATTTAKKTTPVVTDILEKYNQATLKTNLGDITISFYNSDSPITVKNFLTLAEKGFYDKTQFHRVIKDFMIQGGDPLSKDASKRSIHGTGGPGYKFADEFNNHKLVKGSMAMANSGPNTNGSQFFIVTANTTPWLDGKHTNFGQVVKGMDVVTKIENVDADMRDNPTTAVVIESIKLEKK